MPTPFNNHFNVFYLRAKLNHLFRDFFFKRHVLEVETPILSAAGNTEPNIESFTTEFTGHKSAGVPLRWLRTSPEYPLKRLLAAGIGDCYELGRVFRNGEAGGRHNPEFTMLEWYRLGWNERQLWQETIELIEQSLALVNRTPSTIQILSYRDLYQTYLGIDPFTASEAELLKPLNNSMLSFEDLSRDDLLDILMTHYIQPRFLADQITVVFDWPASQCALAKIRNDIYPVAERFELYLGTYEVANGYHELTNSQEQHQRFLHDNQRRQQRDLIQPPIDQHLLDALAHGLPDCAGVAVGVDRVLMGLLQTDKIADVIAFDFSKS